MHLVFNGEIYNYQQLRDTLRHRGHDFSSETDSEVILHGYEEWGAEVLQRLEGMFAFGIWDDTTEDLFLARDSFGIKPLHYRHAEGRFQFASEIKAIVADERVPRDVSPEGLQSYLTYRYIPAPFTIWDDIYKLPPAHYLEFDGSTATVERYWDLSEYVDKNSPSPGDAVEELEDRLQSSVEKHLISDVPVGVLLSGGLDSGTITAMAADSNPELAAFSMGFEGQADELGDATQVATKYDLDHLTTELTIDGLKTSLDDILYYYDEPLADSSMFPTFSLMNHVSRHLKVALAGDGGDELFAGYNWYDRYLYFKRFNGLSPVFDRLHDPVRRANDVLGSNILQSLEWRLELAGLTGLDQYQMAMHPPLSDDWQREILTESYVASDTADPVSAFADDRMEIKDIQFLDTHSFLPGDILAKVDRASMAHSLEIRVPMLDRNIAEYSFSLAENLIFRNREKKYLLKQVAKDYLPSSLLNRPKSGFGAPLEEMGFIDEYRSVLRDSVAARDGVLDQRGLESFLDSRPRSSNLFKLILFELWYRQWAT
jgi:asparagine synthase (glutamine-hydrolysing)